MRVRRNAERRSKAALGAVDANVVIRWLSADGCSFGEDR